MAASPLDALGTERPQAPGTSRPLGAQDLFRHQAPPPLRVEVPEVGGHVHVRVLSAGERATLDFDSPDFAARVTTLAACDAAGKRLFDDGAEKELAELEDGRVVFRVADAAVKHNALLKGDREEAAKNS